jgi:hypothetical protein
MMGESGDQRGEVPCSAEKTTDAVLRLLRREQLDELSGELRVEAHRLAVWRDEFLPGGKESLKGRSAARDGMSEEQRRSGQVPPPG